MENKINFYDNNLIEILYAESRHSFPLHSHDSFCFGFVIQGDILFSIDNKEEIVHESMAFIIPSHAGVTIKTSSLYKYVVICFKKDYEKVFENIRFKDYYFHLDSVEKLMSLCAEYERSNDDDEFINAILSIITSSVEHEFFIKEENRNYIVKEACTYIKDHADEKFNLDDLAKNIHISKYYLIRLFKKQMGVTPNQYYIQAKMRLVKKEIFEGINETDLAAKLEFSDQSHLCKVFKKQMGISLKSYKNNLRRK